MEATKFNRMQQLLEVLKQRRKCAFSSGRSTGISESKQKDLSSKGINPSSRKV
jgi:hypothetical protein